MDPVTATLILTLIGVVRTLADGGTLTADQRQQLADAEKQAEAKLVADIDKDLGGTT